MNTLSSSESLREKIILQEINETIPNNIQERYNFLRSKKEEEFLQELEYQELLTFVSYIESHDVKRLKLFIELAELKNMPLDVILKEFEVKGVIL